MVVVHVPLYSILASGWFGRYFYRRTKINLAPYPISLSKKNLLTSEFYRPMGWIYTRRRTWHGIVPTAIQAFIPPDPKLPIQIGQRVRMKEAVEIWQGMTKELKDVYNKMRWKKNIRGYNKFISLYLKQNPAMPIYWMDLKKSSSDNSTIEDVFVSKFNPFVYSHFNFLKYQLVDAVLHKGDNFPSSPVEGQLFYNESDDKVYVYKNGSWSEIGAGGGVSLPFVVVDGSGGGDYTNLKDAIDSLPSTGGVVYVKEGNYTIEETINIEKNNVFIIGANGNVNLKAKNGLNNYLIKIGDGSNTFYNLSFFSLNFDFNSSFNSSPAGIYLNSPVENIKFLHCKFINTPTNHIYSTYTSEGLYIEKCHFENSVYAGVDVNGFKNVYIYANTFKNCGGIYSGAVRTYINSNVLIKGNRFEDTRGANGGTAIFVDSASSGTNYLTVDGNYIEGCYMGIYFVPPSSTLRDIKIINNTFKDIYLDAISGAYANSIISGNYFYRIGGFGITNMYPHTTVSDNVFEEINQSAINLSSIYCNVVNNQILSTNAHGIVVSNGVGNKIIGNTIYAPSLGANNVHSAIFLFGSSTSKTLNTIISNNTIIGPTSGNRKKYSIEEYGSYVNYSIIIGNSLAGALTNEFYISGSLTDVGHNTIGSG